ncbi:D-alanine--D-alanine ligase [Patescibacteria group bacterium]|nr:D-alanine--D-alanine ligase [Patescibacteria group bacterium]
MKTIGVFFGGKSPEHDVSIITGEFVIAGLKKLGFAVVPIYIDNQGKWFVDEALGELKFFTEGRHKTMPKSFGEFYVDIVGPQNKLTLKKKGLTGKTIIIDAAFPALHGQNGEDGTIQGLFEMLNVPYVGCDTASSALAMDKALTKMMYRALDIPTTKFIVFGASDWLKRKNELLRETKENLRMPLFVKPCRLGSSIGIQKVKTEQDFEFAVEVALHYDEKIIIEEAVEHCMDVTCALLGGRNPRPSLLQESAFRGDLFSYEAKYLEGGGAQLGNNEKTIIIPARLNETTTKEIQNLAIKVFRAFGCFGTARVDFLFDTEAKKIYVNEINTMPGTLYHHLWKASGVLLDELLQELIRLAEERHKNKKNIIFESDILKHANAIKLQMKK